MVPILALLTTLVSVPAVAQSPLGADIVRTDSLSPTQRQQIATYVSSQRVDLLSDDAVACQRARKRLSEPLEFSGVSLEFRREYSRLLLEVIQAGVAEDDDHVAVNCLLVAGLLATPQSVGELQAALADPRVPVRYGAVAGLTSVMAQIDANSPAIFDDAVADVVRRLGQLVQEEESPVVYDAAVRALVAASKQGQFAVVRTAALDQLHQSVASRVRAENGPLQYQVLIGSMRALDALRARLIDDINNLQAKTARDAAVLSGHLLSLLAERIDAGDFDEWESDADIARLRTAAAEALQLGEATIRIVNDDYLNPGQPLSALNLADQFRNGDFNEVVIGIEDGLLGPRGVLIRPPFNNPPGTFDR